MKPNGQVLKWEIKSTFPCLLVYTVTRIGLALHIDEQQRSKWVAARWMLAALFVFPTMFLFMYVAISGDIAWSLVQSRLVCCLAPILTLLLLPMAKQAAEEFNHESQWASLELDE